MGAAMSLITLDSEVRSGMSDDQVIKKLRDRYTFNKLRDCVESDLRIEAKAVAQHDRGKQLNELKLEKKRRSRRNMFGPVSSRE
ncbi:hypothetical protein D9M71_710160 [compost metagenome]